MRLFIPAALCACLTLQGSLLPIFHLDETTLKAFHDYIAVFDKNVVSRFETSGKLWIDDECCGKQSSAFENGKPVIEPRENDDVANGSIHHFSGAVHLAGARIED